MQAFGDELQIVEFPNVETPGKMPNFPENSREIGPRLKKPVSNPKCMCNWPKFSRLELLEDLFPKHSRQNLEKKRPKGRGIDANGINNGGRRREILGKVFQKIRDFFKT
jgi:hypothetical protein